MPKSYLFFLLLVLSVFPANAQVHEGRQLVQAKLLADVDAIVPGQPFRVGVLLEMVPKWHTYWQYPGDAGLATSITWSNPEGFKEGPIQWPLPGRYKEPGDLVVFAYGGQTLLITEVTPPESGLGSQEVLHAKVEWLVCEEICIPGSADLELALPVAPTNQPANKGLFDRFAARVPSLAAPSFPVEIERTDSGYRIEVENLPEGAKADFFPLPPGHVKLNHGESVSASELVVPWPKDEPLKGVLAVINSEGLAQGWEIGATTPDTAGGLSAPAMGGSAGNLNLWSALLYGFIGGLILNVMPCVLPVISLKIFGFIRQAGEDRRRILMHGLAFTAGIFLFFLGLGLMVAGLKSAGHQVTWAFQFQSPHFNIVMSVIVLAFALNLFGVYEFTLPGKAGQTMDSLGQMEGYLGSFFQGLFATLLATPCTAPFLAPALGFAFAQPPGIILTIFGSVAFGMASPYLLLSVQPGWLRWLPKPGVWMEKVKQLMGFALLATLVWLLFILGVQTGADGIVMTLAFLVCVALACWIYGAFASAYSRPSSRVIAGIVIAGVLVGGGWTFLGRGFPTAATSVPVAGGGIEWVRFEPEVLEKYLSEGRGVFLDFTAAWCLTCKVNERLAIDRPAVHEALAASGLIPMKADWTNSDPAITAELAKFGRVGVPFYVIYPPGNAAEPIVLPELLTEQIVLDGIQEAIDAQNQKNNP